jgi:hypothetical protein
MSEHPSVKAGRERKAMDLEFGLRARGIDSTAAESWPQEIRNEFAAAHKIRPPSEETWALVIRMLRDDEEHRDARAQGNT